MMFKNFEHYNIFEHNNAKIQHYQYLCKYFSSSNHNPAGESVPGHALSLTKVEY